MVLTIARAPMETSKTTTARPLKGTLHSYILPVLLSCGGSDGARTHVVRRDAERGSGCGVEGGDREPPQHHGCRELLRDARHNCPQLCNEARMLWLSCMFGYSVSAFG